MSQQKAEEHVTSTEAEKLLATEVMTSKESITEPTSVLPFNEEITQARNHLNMLLEQLSLDSKRMQQQLDAMEPRQRETEQQLQQLITQLETLGRDVGDKLQQLEEKQDHLTEENAAEAQRTFKALELLEQRVSRLEPTPAKLELLAEKLGQLDNRLDETTQQLAARIEELERINLISQARLSDLAQRNHKLEEKAHELELARKAMVASVSRRSRFFGAIAATLIVAVIGALYLLDAQQIMNNQQNAELNVINQQIVEAQQLNSEQSAKLNAMDEQIAALDATVNPKFDVTSSAITIPVFDSDWVLAQKPEHYTIQLYGSESKAEAFNFIRQVQYLMVDSVAYVKTEHRLRDWYVVLYGNYENKGEAEAILNILPQLLRREGTQVREMGWVQQRV